MENRHFGNMAQKNAKLSLLAERFSDDFPNHPITFEQLKNPTESFFRETLLFLFQNCKINITGLENTAPAGGKNLRATRSRIVSITNQLLEKLSDDPMKICYMDLVKPPRTVVFEIIKMLLSYTSFVKKAFDEMDIVKKNIKERENLRNKKNQLRKVIEESKIHNEQNLQMIKDTEKQIPHCKSTISALMEREEHLKKELLSLHLEMEKCDLNIDEMKSQQLSIKENIVNDDEAQNIIETREQIMQQLIEQEEVIAASRQSLKENSATIEKIQSLIIKMEQIFNISNFDMSDMKKMKKDIENLETSINELRFSNEQSSTDIQNTSIAIDQKTKIIEILSLKKEEAEAVFNNLTRANSNIIRQKNVILKELEAKEDSLFTTKNIIKEEIELLYKIASNIIKQMSESFFQE